MTCIDRNSQFPGRKKRETNGIRPMRTEMSVVRSDMYEGANMSNKGLRMSNSLVRISTVMFLLAVSFWFLSPFDVNLDSVWMLIRTRCLRWIFSRLGWGWKGPLAVRLVAHCVEWIFSFMEGNLPLYVIEDQSGASSSKQPSFDLNLSPAEQVVIEVNERVLFEVNTQKQELADLLEPLVRNEAKKYPGVNMEKVPSPRDLVELLISRIGSKVAREENDRSQQNDLTAPDFKSHLKKWLTRACNNAEDATQGQLSIRSEIRTIIEQYGLNDREN